MQGYQKLTKNHTKTLIFTILDMSQKKISDCMNINSVNPLYLGITRANGYIEDKGINKYLIFDSTYMKIKNYLKIIIIFLMKLEIKSKK